jgi:hypothetical protein
MFNKHLLSAIEKAQSILKDDNTFSPPDGARSAAKRALEWIADGKAGGGFTSVGRKRASDLAAGHSVSLDTVKRIKAYFDRHQVDKKATGFNSGEEGYPSPGRVAWDAWGGDAAWSWATSIADRKKSDEVEKAKKVNYDKIIPESKSEPIDEELYNQIKREAKRKFDVYPSAVANAWLSGEYKRRGGKYSSKPKKKK